MNVSFVAYHGTHPDQVELIRATGVQPSANDDDWLGCGSYFFVDGLAAPQQAAVDWAMCASWDKAAKRFRSERAALIEVLVTVPNERVIDLRDPTRMREFHGLRREWLGQKIATLGIDGSRPTQKSYDTEFLNEMKSNFGAAVVIGNFHIQLSPRERFFRLDSRVPNVSVLCVTAQCDESVSVTIRRVDILDRSPSGHRDLAWR